MPGTALGTERPCRCFLNPQPHPVKTRVARHLLPHEVRGHVRSWWPAVPSAVSAGVSGKRMTLALPAGNSWSAQGEGPGASEEPHEEVQPASSTSTAIVCRAPLKILALGPVPSRLLSHCLSERTVWDFHPSWLIFRGFFRTGLLHGLKTTRIEISVKTCWGFHSANTTVACGQILTFGANSLTDGHPWERPVTGHQVGQRGPESRVDASWISDDPLPYGPQLSQHTGSLEFWRSWEQNSGTPPWPLC